MPIGGNLSGLLRDGVDVRGDAERHDISIEAVDDGARLGARAAIGGADRHRFAGLRLPVVGEGRVEILVEFAGRVIADIGDGDIGESQGRIAEAGERDDESGRADRRKRGQKSVSYQRFPVRKSDHNI